MVRTKTRLVRSKQVVGFHIVKKVCVHMFFEGLDSTGRRDIGLKLSGSIASFFFGKGIT